MHAPLRVVAPRLAAANRRRPATRTAGVRLTGIGPGRAEGRGRRLPPGRPPALGCRKADARRPMRELERVPGLPMRELAPVPGLPPRRRDRRPVRGLPPARAHNLQEPGGRRLAPDRNDRSAATVRGLADACRIVLRARTPGQRRARRDISRRRAVPAEVERHDDPAAAERASPVFTFMVVYHVGSRNEAPGNTGSAHLLEHMIFNKSTENFGRANGHKTFQEVLYEGRRRLLGSSNMTTWYDRMNGYSTLPADKLELAMRSRPTASGAALILDVRAAVRDVGRAQRVRDRRERPVRGARSRRWSAAAIQAHPYHWNTIGYRSDIEGVTTEKLREHYKTYFHPDNAEAILVGDFDTDAALAIFDRAVRRFQARRSRSPGHHRRAAAGRRAARDRQAAGARRRS